MKSEAGDTSSAVANAASSETSIGLDLRSILATVARFDREGDPLEPFSDRLGQEWATRAPLEIDSGSSA
jgi:hypothetical protein